MRKSVLVLSIALIAVIIILQNCSKKEESTTVSKITGMVTYDNQMSAKGAIVTLSSEPNAAKVLTRVVADSTGSYSIVGITDGTYYLSAKYNTENKNYLKSGTDITFVTGQEAMVTVSGADVAKDIALVSTGQSTTDIVDATWTFDQTHSLVGFSFPYDSANADFSGHFAKFGLNQFTFNPASLSTSKIDAWVDITSTETGAPTTIDTVKRVGVGGRDGLNGCISHTFGVQCNPVDTFFKGYYRPTSIIGTTGMASFVSTTIATYGDGYVATGNLTFHAFTKPVNLYFHYIPGYTATTNGTTNKYVSFAGFFSMNALKDFNIVSKQHLRSKPVRVLTNLQFYKKQ